MRTLSNDQYDALLMQSDVIEKDRHGIKVVRLSDGNFLKTFWYRHRISSRRLYPEWLRFVLHAGALKRREIPTVTVLESVRIPHLQRTAVIYQPLPGRTLRQVAADGEFDASLAEKLGRFVAQLHRKGILFRSLHLGNILLGPDGNLGLIDLSDMIIRPWPLLPNTRMRNFIHLFRYEGDFKILVRAGIREFLEQYIKKQPAPKIRRRLHRTVKKKMDV
jgi:serine/threonine protein kinase